MREANSEDDSRERIRQAMARVLRTMPPHVATEARAPPRSDLDSTLWLTSWILVLLLGLCEVAAEHSGYLPVSHLAGLRLLTALGAFGLLIVFPDRVAAWIEARLELARGGVSPRWLVGLGIAGFAATWCLAALNSTMSLRAYPLLAVLGLCSVRRLLAWAERTPPRAGLP